MKFSAPALAVLAIGAASAAVTPAPKNACQVLQSAKLINLDVLGCSNIDVSVLSSTSKVTKKQACKALQSGGLINLDVLGCSNVDLDILSTDDAAVAATTKCSTAPTCQLFQNGLLDLNLLGCLSLNLDILKRGAPHHTTTTTKKTTTSTKTTTTKKPTSTPKPCSNAAACKILQKGGLINLSVLGCADIDIDIL